MSIGKMIRPWIIFFLRRNQMEAEKLRLFFLIKHFMLLDSGGFLDMLFVEFMFGLSRYDFGYLFLEDVLIRIVGGGRRKRKRDGGWSRRRGFLLFPFHRMLSMEIPP